MVADAVSGKIDLIITKSVSRFARNTVDSLTTIRKLNTALTRQREDKQFKADELGGFLFELGELDLLDTEWKDSRFRAIVERITVHNDERLVFTFTNGSEETVMM